MARFALAVLLLLCARALADEGCASDGTCHADEDENAALLQKSAAHKATVTEHMHTNATVGCGPFDLGCECTGKTCIWFLLAKPECTANGPCVRPQPKQQPKQQPKHQPKTKPKPNHNPKPQPKPKPYA